MEARVELGSIASSRTDEYDDLLALLLAHASSLDALDLAPEIATACLGDNHLWQDLGLASRQLLSDMLETHFHGLYVKNTGNMKWKKFFYKQLCEIMEVRACRAPSCSVCADYDNCFGPEVVGTRPM